jgi:isopenicillin-N epimerase
VLGPEFNHERRRKIMTSDDHACRGTTGLERHWPLDPEVTHLNHGSFGACPLHLLEFQNALRFRLERDPMRFFTIEMEELLDAARRDLARFVGAEPDDLSFITNATAGVNTVLRSLQFRGGDQILTTDHEYKACKNAIDFVAGRTGATVVVAEIPFPLDSPDRAFDAIMSRVTGRTRLALIDHVTSPTGLILPVRDLVSEMSVRGVDTLVDGAHAPGMIPFSIDDVGAAYYTANCHKWLCAPKGSAFLHVRHDKQPEIHPLPISLWADSPRTDRSRFRLEFDWTGTSDPTACLTVPEAIRFMGSLLPGGWPELMARNHALAVDARAVLARALRTEPPCPDDMMGSMATLPLPDGFPSVPTDAFPGDPLERTLRDRFGIVVPVFPWPQPPKRLFRVSAQLYNSLDEYERLADAFRQVL